VSSLFVRTYDGDRTFALLYIMMWWRERDERKFYYAERVGGGGSFSSSFNMMRRIKNDGRSASLIITARTAPQNARVAWESDGMASVLLFFFFFFSFFLFPTCCAVSILFTQLYMSSYSLRYIVRNITHID
jgi:hypothetical protein